MHPRRDARGRYRTSHCLVLRPIWHDDSCRGRERQQFGRQPRLDPARPRRRTVVAAIHTEALVVDYGCRCSRSGSCSRLPRRPSLDLKLPHASKTMTAARPARLAPPFSVRGRCSSQTLSASSTAKLEAPRASTFYWHIRQGESDLEFGTPWFAPVASVRKLRPGDAGRR